MGILVVKGLESYEFVRLFVECQGFVFWKAQFKGNFYECFLCVMVGK